MDVFTDGREDWGGFAREDVLGEFEWVAGHVGARGSERRVILAFRTPDGSERAYALGAPTALAIAAELAQRADAEAPPPPFN